MPESVEQVTIATIALGVLLALCTLAVRRWGTEAGPEPLVLLWRRWGALGRPQQARPRASGPERGRRATSVRPRRVARAQARGSGGHDHVPLEVPASEDKTAQVAEPKLAMRHRLRRGMRKTRDYLNRDVKEVFGRGPTDEAFDTLEEALVKADVGVAVATGLSDDLRAKSAGLTAQTLPGALKEAMVVRLAGADRRLRLSRDGVSVWVVVGVNGTGKTTSIAKLAARAKALGLNVCIAAADTFRAAAAEQLEEWGKRLEVDVVRQKAGADPAAVVFDAISHAKAEGSNLVIVDTAGRLHTRRPLMDELRKVVGVVERAGGVMTECLLVIDATTGQNGIVQAKAFKEAVDVSGLVLAKLDGTAKGGIAFAVEHDLGVPVKAVGTGEGHRDLVPFEPETFVDALLGLGEEV